MAAELPGSSRERMAAIACGCSCCRRAATSAGEAVSSSPNPVAGCESVGPLLVWGNVVLLLSLSFLEFEFGVQTQLEFEFGL